MSASSRAGGQCGSGFQRCRAFLRSWSGLVGFENFTAARCRCHFCGPFFHLRIKISSRIVNPAVAIDRPSSPFARHFCGFCCQNLVIC